MTFNISNFTNYHALKQVLKRATVNCFLYPEAICKGQLIKSYWGFHNFGDLITPYILHHLGFSPVQSLRVSYSDVVITGSFLDSISSNYDGIIVGAGFLRADRPKLLTHANVIGIRGALSKSLIGKDADNSIVLGDSGLALSRFISSRSEKKYELGIIPHYLDYKDSRIWAWYNKYKSNIHIINVLQPPELVFLEISSCNYILSSSLHGLVIADSLNIPNRWIQFVCYNHNSSFKFHDYYSAFGMHNDPFIPSGSESLIDLLNITKILSTDIERVIDEIYKSLIRMKPLLIK